MKYEVELIIDLPRERVIELFDNPDNLAKWQPGLQSFEHISGEAGQPGAKSRLIYDENGHRVEMIETVTKNSLPDEFAATFEAKNVKNWISNTFYEEGPEKTRWVSENEYKFSGLMWFTGIFMRGAFPNQSLEFMELFKEFAENA